jgi:hypothetical protein
MTEGGVVMGIEEEVDKIFSSESPPHKRMVDYVVGQLDAGRHLEEIMQDPNLTSSLSALDRRAVLEDHRVAAAAHADIIAAMRAKLDAALGE